MRTHPPRRPGAYVLWGLALLTAVAPPSLAAQPAPGRARTAEVLLTLTQYTTWQGALSLSDEVAVCVLGDDPFGAALDLLTGRVSRGRRVVVRRFLEATSARGCHVVFVSASGRGRLADVLPVLHGAGALTVSDAPGFARRGGMVRLYADGPRVGLEVNLDALRRGRVRLSSRVLRLARVV
jgi:hypothetical protein